MIQVGQRGKINFAARRSLLESFPGVDLVVGLRDRVDPKGLMAIGLWINENASKVTVVGSVDLTTIASDAQAPLERLSVVWVRGGKVSINWEQLWPTLKAVADDYIQDLQMSTNQGPPQ